MPYDTPMALYVNADDLELDATSRDGVTRARREQANTKFRDYEILERTPTSFLAGDGGSGLCSRRAARSLRTGSRPSLCRRSSAASVLLWVLHVACPKSQVIAQELHDEG